MSLIESALARVRELSTEPQQAGAKPHAQTTGAAAAVATAATKARALPAFGPGMGEPLEAPPLPLSFSACQEHRVLLEETARRNAKAVAAFRILRTRILQRARSHQWSTIGVTSAGINDGKSLTTLNLSLSLARERNSQVILVDLDMRNPSMCRYLGVEPRQHLSNFFEGRVNAREMFFSIGIDNLTLAAGTTRTEHASELLATAKLDELLQYIKQHTHNPIVLVDLPPLLNTDDALGVLPKLDAVLLVASEGFTDRGALAKAAHLLNGVPLAGLVLNRSVETGGGYGYYGYGSDY